MARTTTRSKRVATVVPLALVSAAWAAHVAAPTTPTASTATAAVPATPLVKPEAQTVGPDPVDAPASLSTPASISAGDGTFVTVAATPTTGDIPAEALAAYQRAETVINAADPSCGLGWQLLAAIGRIESDHGRHGGATLGTDGVSTPSIIGPVLDGRNGTASIRDTDAGQYDGDTAFDRAVGPLQFIPSTWSVVGVDADDDGERNPLDIDDAALAAAVYLCSGTDDLTKAPGQRLAVFRYNHSDAYVDQVLSIMGGYLQGDYTAGPGPLLSARTREIEPLVAVAGPRAAAQPVQGPVAPSAEPAPETTEEAAQPVDPAPVEPTDPIDPTEPVDPTDPVEPTDPVDPTEPTDPAEPGGEPTDPADPADPADPTEPVAPEPETLSAEDAATYCADDLALVDDESVTDDDYDVCVTTYTDPDPDAEDEADEPAPVAAPVRDESVATEG